MAGGTQVPERGAELSVGKRRGEDEGRGDEEGSAGDHGELFVWRMERW